VCLFLNAGEDFFAKNMGNEGTWRENGRKTEGTW
jgi:hypothetical protein